jgi:AcrR family transcriptional regulator
MVQTRRTQAERRATTRAALLAAGRELFAARGYADAPREAIVERAGVTPGALHHHFDTKKDLFQAVVEEIEQELVDRIQSAAAAAEARGADVATQAREGLHAYLRACTEPDVVQICVRDAPAVLGPEVLAELDERYCLGLLAEGFSRLAGGGVPIDRLTPAVGELLLGAANAAGRAVGVATDRDAALAEMSSALDVLLDGVLGPAASPARRR